MTTPQRVASLLVQLYPAAWRREYGAELEAVLLARPLGIGTVNDVVWSALGQHVRYAAPPVVLGTAAMAAVAAWLWVNLTMPETMTPWGSLLRHTTMLRPSVIMWPFRSEAYVLLLLACGAWTYIRTGTTAPRAGFAAMEMTGLAGLPVMFVGLLMAFDVVSLPTYSALPVFSASFYEFGSAWVWGALGGLLGRGYVRRRGARLEVRG